MKPRSSIFRSTVVLVVAAAASLSLAPARGVEIAVPNPDGERLYRQGITISGQPLHARREPGLPLSGAEAACIQCHRRSGRGTVEGRIVIPPIDSKALFPMPVRAQPPGAMKPRAMGERDHHGAYDDAALARAVRSGIGADGRVLDYLMPRFALDDANMASLAAYLRQLGSAPVPGVEEETLHFATIITPDADRVAARGMLDVLEQFFATRNASYRGESPPLQSARRIHFRVLRQWKLHVWRLAGPASTWEAQLDEHARAEPVFAVISGISGSTWEPVHRFCQSRALPCLLPNVDLPTVEEGDFYPVYFSQGVILEARLLAHRMAQSDAPRRIVQVYREGDIGARAAAALRAAASPRSLVEDRILHEDASLPQLAAASAAGPGDVLVLWLRRDDLERLPAEPPPAATLFASGLMGGLEGSPLPAAWIPLVRMTYPFELPDQRRARMNYPLGWFSIHHIAVPAERVQTDTYIACTVLAEALGTMLDDFVRDYLVERVEGMLSARLLNGYYPHLGLAPGQRFASKGGYIVRFGDSASRRILADGEWTVPWASGLQSADARP